MHPDFYKQQLSPQALQLQQSGQVISEYGNRVISEHENKGKGKMHHAKGKGKGKGKSGNSESKFVWDYDAQTYVEYQVVAAKPPPAAASPEVAPLENSSQPIINNRWTGSKKKKAATASTAATESDAASESEQDAAQVKGAALRADLAALVRAQSAVKDDTTDRAVQLKASLALEASAIRRSITATKPLAEQMKVLDGAYERKALLLDKQQGIILDAKITADKLKKEIAEISSKVSQIQQAIAVQEAEAAQMAAAQAHARAQIAEKTLQTATPFQFGVSPTYAAQGTPLPQQPMLTANHLVFLKQMAMQFLSPEHAQLMGLSFEALQPYLSAAGVTPYDLPTGVPTPLTTATEDPYLQQHGAQQASPSPIAAGTAAPTTPATHIAAGGPPPTTTPMALAEPPSPVQADHLFGGPPPSNLPSRSGGRTLQRNPSDESADSRASSRRRIRAKTADPCRIRSVKFPSSGSRFSPSLDNTNRMLEYESPLESAGEDFSPG